MSIPLGGSRSTQCIPEVVLRDVIGITAGVDIIHPNETVGSLRAYDCVFRSINDGIGVVPSIPTEWYNCHLAVQGDPIDLVGSPFYFPVRLFFNTGSHKMFGGSATANTLNRSADPGKQTWLVDSGNAVTVEFFNVLMHLAGYTGTDCAIVGPYTAGTNMKATVNIYGGRITSEITSGAASVVDPATWAASTGGVEVHYCDLNGHDLGGGGDQPAAANYNIA